MTLTDSITGWLLLKRAGLSRGQHSIIQTNVVTKMAFSTVMEALYLIFDQDYKHVRVPANHRLQQPASKWRPRQMAQFVGDETEKTFWQHEGDYELDEWEGAYPIDQIRQFERK